MRLVSLHHPHVPTVSPSLPHPLSHKSHVFPPTFTVKIPLIKGTLLWSGWLQYNTKKEACFFVHCHIFEDAHPLPLGHHTRITCRLSWLGGRLGVCKPSHLFAGQRLVASRVLVAIEADCHRGDKFVLFFNNTRVFVQKFPPPVHYGTCSVFSKWYCSRINYVFSGGKLSVIYSCQFRTLVLRCFLKCVSWSFILIAHYLKIGVCSVLILKRRVNGTCFLWSYKLT